MAIGAGQLLMGSQERKPISLRGMVERRYSGPGQRVVARLAGLRETFVPMGRGILYLVTRLAVGIKD